MLEIPLTSAPEQFFTLSTEKLGTIAMRVIANSRLEQWSASFYLQEGGQRTPIISGIALVGGVAILDQYPSLPWDTMYVLNTDEPVDPTLDNLGTVNKLILFQEGDFTLEDSDFVSGLLA
jgi:hypothetical protein